PNLIGNTLGGWKRVSDCRRRIFRLKWAYMKYSNIITIEPGKRGGKPCIRGLRITVYDVLDNLAAGMTHAEILKEFPYLTEEDILACLAFAAERDRKLEVLAE
ncbi:MAG: DUF433 domain-containing protein, partial [Candidatus Acidiferrum sp.]